MHSLAQRCRPKHQVLVLKCYPRTTKGAVDVKPNSSELSYLLYYATSRRTKILKVGSFLEKKTASDVWRQRIGNVQVTLQILEALIEKNPKDLPLFAQNVLTILDLILRSNDITMVESSIPTFEAFCANHDASTLLADQAYLAQFEAVVRHYASFASTRPSLGKTQPSKPVVMRWRNAGLEAIRAVASADALSSISGRQYDMIVPMILENLWTTNENFLDVLLQRAEVEDKVDDNPLKHRTSVATVRTAGTAGDTNPLALSGTATDVDKLAEEDNGVLAMQCLKQIFITPSRTLIHLATTALLDFVKDRVDQGETVVRTNLATGKDAGWAVKIFSLLMRWAPVQERYIILNTTLDKMAKMPLSDQSLDRHNALAAMVSSLLRSDASLIGLSVMDVLIGFMQQIKKLVQMPGDPATAAATAAANNDAATASDGQAAGSNPVATAAGKRKELLTRLQHCIGDLATHVYYADQISDMVTTILLRLKPGRSASGSNPTPPGEKSDDFNVDQQGQAQYPADSLFGLTVAKTAVLRAVKAILLVANPNTKVNGNQALSRNRVPMHVWEGTHFMLRDPDGQVRRAYVDALLTWLNQETTHASQVAHDESTIALGGPATLGHRNTTKGSLAGLASSSEPFSKRTVSSASNRENGYTAGAGKTSLAAAKTRRMYFLPLLHLAIYDNALQYVDYENDLVLLHILLNQLVERLGINAVRYGLPMIFQLQEAIQEVETPQAKVRVGCLVHGYFWTVTDKFRFDSSVVGHAIRNEITRRRSKNFWIDGVHVPAPTLDYVGQPGVMRQSSKMQFHDIESEALLPYDDRQAFVDSVCGSYHDSLVASSPPQTPAVSPGRLAGGAAPTMSAMAIGGAVGLAIDGVEEVPPAYKDQMLSDWSRDNVAQLAQQPSASNSVSLNGSRTGNSGSNVNTTSRHRLFTNTSSGLSNGPYNVNGSGLSPSNSHQNLRQMSLAGNGINNDDTLSPLTNKLPKSNSRNGMLASPVSSRNGGGRNGTGFVTSVDQLKSVLAGGALPTTRADQSRRNDEDGSSESMASYDPTSSETSYNPALGGPVQAVFSPSEEQTAKRGLSVSRKASNLGEPTNPLGANPLDSSQHQQTEAATANGSDYHLDGGSHQEGYSVPPVPTLPETLSQDGNQDGLGALVKPTGENRRTVRSPASDSVLSSSYGDESSSMDLQSLLKGIDSRAGEHTLGNVSKPPY